MSWWNRFGRSLVFAIVVAGGYPLYAAVLTPCIGGRLAFASYGVATAALYLLGIASRPTPGLGAAFALVATASLFALAGATGGQLALVVGILIGVLRSGLLQPGGAPADRGFARRFVREVVFIGTGLGLALFFAAGSRQPEALAFWGFYLAQSGFFLLGGGAARVRARGAQGQGPDAFAKAIRRAREVLAEADRMGAPR